MKILVNNIAASEAGAKTVLIDFYNYVRENVKQHEWYFLVSVDCLQECEHIKVIRRQDIKQSNFKKVLFDEFTGKRIVRSINPDLIISLQNIVFSGVNVPQVVYVHQPLPFQKIKNYSLFKKQERELAIKQKVVGYFIKRSIKRADRVIVQTNAFKNRVADTVGNIDGKILTIAPSVNYIDIMVDENKYSYNDFVYPTSEYDYKNNRVVYDACKILEKKDIGVNVELTVDSVSNIRNVKHIGIIERNAILEKYAKSTLVFASTIESFGYPLVEAKKIGSLILVADTEVSRELVGDYENAYFFDPFCSTELSMLMEKVVKKEIVLKKVCESYKHDGWKEFIDIVNEYS